MRLTRLFMLVVLAFVIVGVFTLTGCTPPVDEEKFMGAVAVQVARSTMDTAVTPNTPVPKPVDGKICPECNGKGKVKTGDGISWTECDYCEGTGYTALPMLDDGVSLLDSTFLYADLKEGYKDILYIKDLQTEYIPYTEETIKTVALGSCTSGSCGPVSRTVTRTHQAVRHSNQHLGRRIHDRKPVRKLRRGIRGILGCK